MKVVIYDDWGYFELPDKLKHLEKDFEVEQIGKKIETENDFEEKKRFDKYLRTNKELIEYAESTRTLKVIEIPDDVTDWVIEEYDGWEYVLYVKDGRIHMPYIKPL